MTVSVRNDRVYPTLRPKLVLDLERLAADLVCRFAIVVFDGLRKCEMEDLLQTLFFSLSEAVEFLVALSYRTVAYLNETDADIRPGEFFFCHKNRPSETILHGATT